MIQGGIHLRNILNKKQDGSRDFGELCLALVAMGDGPKIPQAWLDNEKMKTARFLRQKTTQFVETSPNLNKQQIFQKIIEMIEGAEKEILIISPFIDMYSFLMDIAQKNNKIKIKILSKPLSEFKGDRKKFSKAALDTIRTLPNAEIHISSIIHARMIVVDSKKLLISSADLTHDQLYDEFNSGIYTEELDSIFTAKHFFDNIYTNSQPIARPE